jgi:CheY-like chemotaxis protein
MVVHFRLRLPLRDGLVLFVGTTHYDVERITKQGPLQRPRLVPWWSHPYIALLLRRRDHWHRLRMDWLHDRVGLGGQEAVDEMRSRDRLGLGAAIPVERGPDAGEREQAASGEEAVTLVKGRVAAYRALAVDIRLKGRMDGWEVARQTREIDPTFPVIYMTGAASDEWPSRGVPSSILLKKPFAPAQLVTAVSQVLNRSTSTA